MLTSTFLRHHYVVNRVADALNVVGVWQEKKSFVPSAYADNADDEQVIATHFAARDASEEHYFAGERRLRLSSSASLHATAPNGINDPAAVEAMRLLQPDIVLVFGTGLLRAGIIEAFAGRIINLHLGLSPYYRGAGTNFWPLVNRQPEYVGATIHYLDAGIDTGPIIAHARPAMRASDGPHKIGNTAIVAGAATLIDAAKAQARGLVDAVPQAGGGRLYQRKDFSAESVRTLWRNFETGMVAEYLAEQASRDRQIQLASLAQTA